MPSQIVPSVTPTTNIEWKYGWNPTGTVISFAFNIQALQALPQNPPNSNLVYDPVSGFYAYLGENYIELTLPHNLYKWVVTDPNNLYTNPSDSYLAVKRPNDASYNFIPVTNEQDPNKAISFAYVELQDYQLTIDAGINIYRRFYINTNVLTAGTASVPAIPINSNFIIQVTVVGDYVNPLDFNQELNQSASPYFTNVNVTDTLEALNSNITSQDITELDIVQTVNSSYKNGYKSPELNVDDDMGNVANPPINKAFRVFKGVSSAKEFHSPKIISSGNKIQLGVPVIPLATNPQEQDYRNFSSYQVDTTVFTPKKDNAIISFGIPDNLESVPPSKPVIQFNADENSWQVGLAGENSLPIPNQGSYATALFTTLYNILRMSQSVHTLSGFSGNNIPYLDPSNPTNVLLDHDIKFLFEMISNSVTQKTIQGITQIVLGDTSKFDPTTIGAINGFLNSKSLELGKTSPTRDTSLDNGPDSNGTQSKTLLYSNDTTKADVVYQTGIEKRTDGETVVFVETNTNNTPNRVDILKISGDGKTVTLFNTGTNPAGQTVLNINGATITLDAQSLLFLNEGYTPISNPGPDTPETKIWNVNGWNFRGNRVNQVHYEILRMERGSNRPSELDTSLGGVSNLGIYQSPDQPLIPVNNVTGKTTTRISLKKIYEYLFSLGSISSTDPIVGTTPYMYGLTGVDNPYSNNSLNIQLNTVQNIRDMFENSFSSGVDLTGGLVYVNQTEHLLLHERADELDTRKSDKGSFNLGELQVNKKPAFGPTGQFYNQTLIDAESTSSNFNNITTYLGADGLWHYLFNTVVVPIEP